VTVAGVSGTDTDVGTDGTWTVTAGAGAAVFSEDTGVTSTVAAADETTVSIGGISICTTVAAFPPGKLTESGPVGISRVRGTSGMSRVWDEPPADEAASGTDTDTDWESTSALSSNEGMINVEEPSGLAMSCGNRGEELTVVDSAGNKTSNVSDCPEPCWFWFCPEPCWFWFCPEPCWFWFCPEPLWPGLLAWVRMAGDPGLDDSIEPGAAAEDNSPDGEAMDVGSNSSTDGAPVTAGVSTNRAPVTAGVRTDRAPVTAGVSTTGAPDTGVSDGAAVALCPKVFVGAVAAGGGEGVVESVESAGEEVAVLAGGLGAALAAAGGVAALDPDEVPGLAPAPPDAPGPEGVVPPPGGEEGGRAFWRCTGWPPPGIRISEAATTAAAAAAAAPRTGRRR
jgi:hypothetical protein